MQRPEVVTRRVPVDVYFPHLSAPRGRGRGGWWRQGVVDDWSLAMAADHARMAFEVSWGTLQNVIR